MRFSGLNFNLAWFCDIYKWVELLHSTNKTAACRCCINNFSDYCDLTATALRVVNEIIPDGIPLFWLSFASNYAKEGWKTLAKVIPCTTLTGLFLGCCQKNDRD